MIFEGLNAPLYAQFSEDNFSRIHLRFVFLRVSSVFWFLNQINVTCYGKFFSFEFVVNGQGVLDMIFGLNKT